jgi:hypothetical protein
MAVVGASPVTFVSESTQPGKQYWIPLSAITISNGVASASDWVSAVGLHDADSANDGVVAKLLASWVAQGLIVPPPT